LELRRRESLKSYKRVLGALVGLALGASLLVPGAAQADHSATYSVEVGQGLGLPGGVFGFSARFYPSSIRVHRGDTIQFDFPAGLGPEGLYPQEQMGREMEELGSPGSFLEFDPERPPRGLRFNLGALFDEGVDCGTQDNPCVWGPNAEVIFPAFREEPPFDVFVTIDAAPGTTLWAGSIASPNANVNFRVQVVGDGEPTSTQEVLDARAERMRVKDFENAQALHNRMRTRRTSHINRFGQRVFDVFVGASAGPIELFAMYPRRTAVPRRARVQFHFMSEIEPHTATFGGPRARAVANNLFVPVCDPGGLDPVGFDQETGMPICPEGTSFQLLLHEDAPWMRGARVFRNNDYKNSGLIFPSFPEGNIFDENPDPWAVRFPRASSRRGFKFICLIHPFMEGFVRVR
jgi:hypothetical protein